MAEYGQKNEGGVRKITPTGLRWANESQAWPDLHDAIRAARRVYQRAGRIPDVEAVAAMIAERRSK